jgi:hypothetical protein
MVMWRKYEPTLAEILSDSGTRALMRADGVARRDLEDMLKTVARKRLSLSAPTSAHTAARCGMC